MTTPLCAGIRLVRWFNCYETVALPIAGVIDIAQEQARLTSAIAKSDSEIGKLEKKLGNAQFLAKAPESVVEEQKERLSAPQHKMNSIRKSNRPAA